MSSSIKLKVKVTNEVQNFFQQTRLDSTQTSCSSILVCPEKINSKCSILGVVAVGRIEDAPPARAGCSAPRKQSVERI